MTGHSLRSWLFGQKKGTLVLHFLTFWMELTSEGRDRGYRDVVLGWLPFLSDSIRVLWSPNKFSCFNFL